MNPLLLEWWADVPGAPGYRVSNVGRVITNRPDGRTHATAAPWREVRIHRMPNGYRNFFARGAGDTARNVGVHSAMLLAFVREPVAGEQTCHNDGARHHNRLSNLRWGTAKENAADRRLHGTEPRGEQKRNAKLTDELVAWVRESAQTCKDMAHAIGVSVGTISLARLGVNWRSTGTIPEPKRVAKVTWEIVLEIRASVEPNAALARRFNLHDSQVSRIRTGKAWKREPDVQAMVSA